MEPEVRRRGVVGPDVSEAVYVCLEEAGPMFGHLYGFGSFLASPRGAMVASEVEVVSSVAHGEGEKSNRSKSGVFWEKWEKQDPCLTPGCSFNPLLPMKGFP